ncbi:hypothetical protein V6N13_048837 [Hibiscus sabdariffa]
MALSPPKILHTLFAAQGLVKYKRVGGWRRRRGRRKGGGAYVKCPYGLNSSRVISSGTVSAANGYIWKQFGDKLKASYKYLAMVKLKKPTSLVKTGRFRFEVGDGFEAEAVKSRKTDAACCETMVLSDGINKFSGSVSREGEETVVRALVSFPIELNFSYFPLHKQSWIEDSRIHFKADIRYAPDCLLYL